MFGVHADVKELHWRTGVSWRWLIKVSGWHVVHGFTGYRDLSSRPHTTPCANARFFFSRTVSVMVFVLAIDTGQARAQPPVSVVLPKSGATAKPIPWRSYCRRRPRSQGRPI